MLPYGLRLSSPGAASLGPFPGSPGGLAPPVLDLQRAQAQLYDYNARLRMGLQYAAAAGLGGPPHGMSPFHPGAPGPHDPLALLYAKHDPRARFLHEEPKPSHSYIGLIAMAILSSKDKKMVLSDIYQWILDNYAYFRTRGPGWRNSIRHNLSLNDCFIKSGRSANGKGHYWAVHPANVDDFSKGDFRRRRAQRKVRKAMGLAVPDDEDSPSPPPPSGQPVHLEWSKRVLGTAGSPDIDQKPKNAGDEHLQTDDTEQQVDILSPDSDPEDKDDETPDSSPGCSRKRKAEGVPCVSPNKTRLLPGPVPPLPGKKRMFDMDSLLAPDETFRRGDTGHQGLLRIPGPCFRPLPIRGGFGAGFLPPAMLAKDLRLRRDTDGSREDEACDRATPERPRPLQLSSSVSPRNESRADCSSSEPDHTTPAVSPVSHREEHFSDHSARYPENSCDNPEISVIHSPGSDEGDVKEAALASNNRSSVSPERPSAFHNLIRTPIPAVGVPSGLPIPTLSALSRTLTVPGASLDTHKLQEAFSRAFAGQRTYSESLWKPA